MVARIAEIYRLDYERLAVMNEPASFAAAQLKLESALPALLVRRLDKVHPDGLIDMPVVFAAIDFRQQEIEGL